MEQCRGAIILSYPQITIHKGTLRDEKLKTEILLPTEWNHIETALAYAKGLPILLIHHLNIKRGVFDKGAVSKFLYEIDLRKPDWPLDERINGALLSWLPKVKSFSIKSNESQRNERQTLPSDSVVIGTLNRDTLSTDIKAKIVLNESTKPHVNIFLDRIQRISPYCPRCYRPLDTKRASWEANGVQIGYKCKNCQTEYDGTYRNVFNEVLSEVRRNYDKYWETYQKEIYKMTNEKPENYKIP
jgi:hypothetical protein